ncbi:HAD-IA family hydrolase [Salinimonas chungwhensis]|uniref:HAD-IA family hydrolase n=1 Tax=Salinimonas chungwhensis TaxID=265425 RepID=UPI00037D7039|nr:HAD-IA family hydrolase [Salinimonas chungwhensis]
MKDYQLIIFDWDGTLMDSAGKIVSCMQQAAAQCDVPIPDAHAVGNIIGISLRPAIQILFNTRDDKLTDALLTAYKDAYLEKDVTPCPLFTGTMDMLNTLSAHNKTLAVATGKARRGLDRAWKNTQTGHFFVTSRTACEADSKPSPDMLRQILSETGFSAHDALMVGDTVYDMQMAQEIGMDRLAVSYGVHESDRLAAHEPVAIVDSIYHMQTFLLGQ